LATLVAAIATGACVVLCAMQEGLARWKSLWRIPDVAEPAVDRVGSNFARTGLLFLGVSLAMLAAWFLYRYSQPLLVDNSLQFVRSFERMTHPSSGLSTLIPAACIMSALSLWGLFHLRRLRGTGLRDTVGRSLLTDAMVSSNPRRWQEQMKAVLRGPTQSLPRSRLFLLWPLMVASVGYIIACEPISIERTAYTKFFVCAWLLVQAVAALSIMQVMWIWRLTAELLSGTNGHPIAAAFRRIAAKVEFARHRFSLQSPTIEDLAPLVEHRRQLAASLAAIRAPHEQAAALDAPAVAAKRMPFGHYRDLTVAAEMQIDRRDLQALADALNTQTAFDRHAEQHEHWTVSSTWITLLADSSLLLAALKGFWARAPREMAGGDGGEAFDRVRTWYRRAEELIAMQITMVIRELLSRVTSYLMLILALLVLMVTAISSFPIQPKQPLLAFTWVYVIAAIASALAIVVGMERDPILSRLSGTKPNRVNWDADFVLKLVLYGLVPLLTLFAAQFPDIGNTLLRWVAPIQPLP
jgi:hypothetical protein